jgi:hypothetical protein
MFVEVEAYDLYPADGEASFPINGSALVNPLSISVITDHGDVHLRNGAVLSLNLEDDPEALDRLRETKLETVTLLVP